MLNCKISSVELKSGVSKTAVDKDGKPRAYKFYVAQVSIIKSDGSVLQGKLQTQREVQVGDAMVGLRDSIDKFGNIQISYVFI